MKIKVVYENGNKEVLDSVQDFRIVGTCRMSKDGHFVRDIAVRLCDDDLFTISNVLRIEEA